MNNKKDFLGTALIGGLLFKLALPTVVAQLMSDRTAGVYTAEPIADILAVAFTAILFIFQFKKALRKIEAPEEDICPEYQNNI